MFIYQAEKAVDGLADKVLANTSVAYSIEVQKWAEEDRKRIALAMQETLSLEAIRKGLLGVNASLNKHLSAIASISDDDLYYTKSILVSTNWNKNNDVFGKSHVWAARGTPSHKRTNLEHDERQLVGHITGTWALTNEGLLIPNDTVIDDLPDLYHLANGAVIYTNWENDDLLERTSALIEAIEANEKYVSMEALFSDFDYAVITPEKEFYVVGRQADTAFLTKHLTAYGGSGEFDGCKLGRVLKNIIFSGKGYVDKPANPYGVIFNDTIPFSFANASIKNPFNSESGVFISCSNTLSETENALMSDKTVDNLLQQQNTELKETVARLEDRVRELSNASITEKTKSLEGKITALEEKVTAAEEECDKLKAEIKTLTEAKETVDKELAEANEAKTELEKQIADAKAATIKANRVSRLVDGGYEKDVAENKVETFASLSDEQFEAIAIELVSAKKMGKKEDEEEEEAQAGDETLSEDPTSDPTGEAVAGEDTLESVDPNGEPSMSVSASEEDDSEEIRIELRTALASRLKSIEKSDD